MAVTLLNKNYSTNHCTFSYDDWNSDKNSLPNLTTRGKGIFSTLYSCCQGSLAIGTNGTNYILTGNNEWVKYNGNASSGSSGGTGTGELIDIESITDDEIKSLF